MNRKHRVGSVQLYHAFGTHVGNWMKNPISSDFPISLCCLSSGRICPSSHYPLSQVFGTSRRLVASTRYFVTFVSFWCNPYSFLTGGHEGKEEDRDGQSFNLTQKCVGDGKESGGSRRPARCGFANLWWKVNNRRLSFVLDHPSGDLPCLRMHVSAN